MSKFAGFNKVLMAASVVSIICLIFYIIFDNTILRGVCVGLIFATQLIQFSHSSVAWSDRAGALSDSGKARFSNWNETRKINNQKAAEKKAVEDAEKKEKKRLEEEKKARIEARKAEALKRIEDEENGIASA